MLRPDLAESCDEPARRGDADTLVGPDQDHEARAGVQEDADAGNQQIEHGLTIAGRGRGSGHLGQATHRRVVIDVVRAQRHGRQDTAPEISGPSRTVGRR